MRSAVSSVSPRASRRLFPTSMAIRAEISLLRSLIMSAARVMIAFRSFQEVAAHSGANAFAAAMASSASCRVARPK